MGPEAKAFREALKRSGPRALRADELEIACSLIQSEAVATRCGWLLGAPAPLAPLDHFARAARDSAP